MNEWMNEEINEWMRNYAETGHFIFYLISEWMNEWGVNKLMNICPVDINKWLDVYMLEWMSIWMNEWMNEWNCG